MVFKNDTGNDNINYLDFSRDNCWLGAAVGPAAHFYYECVK
jgi:hypothetical protein